MTDEERQVQIAELQVKLKNKQYELARAEIKLAVMEALREFFDAAKAA